VAGCGQVFSLRAAFSAHLTGSHQLEPSAYQQAYGGKGEAYGQYACRICGASIAHKHNNIASHVTLIHDLTLTEYEAKFHPTNQRQAAIGTPTNQRGVADQRQAAIGQAGTPTNQRSGADQRQAAIGREVEEEEEDEEDHYVIDECGPEEGEVDEHYEFTEDDIIIEHALEEEEEGGVVKEEEEVTEVTEVVQGIGEHTVSRFDINPIDF
jgi:hypothetical protein